MEYLCKCYNCGQKEEHYPYQGQEGDIQICSECGSTMYIIRTDETRD